MNNHIDNIIDIAEDFAKRIHVKQHYNGRDYFKGHITPIVMKLVDHELETILLAILHDTVEDSNDPKETLSNISLLFGMRIMEQVLDISKKPGEEYADYIKRVKQSKYESVRTVKKADLEVNIEAYDNITEKSSYSDLRLTKYKLALMYLSDNK